MERAIVVTAGIMITALILIVAEILREPDE